MSAHRGPRRIRIPTAALDGPTAREDLPYPIVHYPQRGVFLAFARDDASPPVLCACARAGLEHAVALAAEAAASRGDPTAGDSALDLALLPERVAESLRSGGGKGTSDLAFEPRLCHRCNMAVPALRYCHELEGGRFVQHYGWYVGQAYLRFGIAPDSLTYLPDVCPPELRSYADAIASAARALEALGKSSENGVGSLHGGADGARMRDVERRYVARQYRRACASLDRAIENAVRQEFGFRPVGEGWVSETLLYQVVRRMYAGHEVLRRTRPPWLNGLELDVYVPELNLAFEYQGQQHYYPVAVWGGAEGLASLLERDRRKAAACAARGVTLIAVDYTEPLTEDHVRARVAQGSPAVERESQ